MSDHKTSQVYKLSYHAMFRVPGLSFLSLFFFFSLFYYCKDTQWKILSQKSQQYHLIFLASYFCVLCILCVVICNIVWFVIGPNFCVLLRHMAKIICISCRKYCIRNALNSGKVRKYNKLTLKVSQIRIFRIPRNTKIFLC